MDSVHSLELQGVYLQKSHPWGRNAYKHLQINARDSSSLIKCIKSEKALS